MIAPLLLAATFHVTSTHCATNDVTVATGSVDLQLVGCSAQYSDNLLWNLDRGDGVTDGSAKRATTGAGAIVYVIDTGVQASHDEFLRPGGTNVIGGLDPYFELTGLKNCGSETPTAPCSGGGQEVIITHGTAVASIVAGKTTGMAPDASIVAVRVFGVSGGTASSIELFNQALDDVVKHAFDPATPPFHTAVINMSATPGAVTLTDPGYPAFDQKMRRMISGVDKDFNPDPNGKKFFFVMAAGNNSFTGATFSGCTPSNGVATYPGLSGPDVDGLLIVGGMDRQNHLWVGSCTGPAVEILAPSDHILCASISGHDHYRGRRTTGNTTTDYSSGTSYAAPFVAGIAARLLEVDPTLTPAELEQRIKASASFIDPSAGTAAGGRVAILIEAPPPAKRRIVAH